MREVKCIPYDSQATRQDADFTEHYTAIRSYLRQYESLPFSSVEDLAQEAFLRAYQSMGRHELPRKPLGWLLSIARSVGIDSLRRQRSNGGTMASIRDPNMVAELDQESPEYQTSLAETKETLVERIGELSPADQELVRGFYYERRSCHDLATALDMTHCNVRVRLCRLRQRIRLAMEEPR